MRIPVNVYIVGGFRHLNTRNSFALWMAFEALKKVPFYLQGPRTSRVFIALVWSYGASNLGSGGFCKALIGP